MTNSEYNCAKFQFTNYCSYISLIGNSWLIQNPGFVLGTWYKLVQVKCEANKYVGHECYKVQILTKLEILTPQDVQRVQKIRKTKHWASIFVISWWKQNIWREERDLCNKKFTFDEIFILSPAHYPPPPKNP